MYAIETYFIGPTNHRGSRIAARVCEDGTGYGGKPRKLTLNWEHRLNPMQNHRAAAKALADRLGWAGVWIEGGGDHGASLWINQTASAFNDSFEVETAPRAPFAGAGMDGQ